MKDMEKKEEVNPHQLITIADLENFKITLLESITKTIELQNGNTNKKWLKSHEVRKLLQISPGKLQTLRSSGVLPYTRIGGIIYYDETDINNLFEDNKVNG